MKFSPAIHVLICAFACAIVTESSALNLAPTATSYGVVDIDGGPPIGGGIDFEGREPGYRWIDITQNGRVVILSGDDVSSLAPRAQGGTGSAVELGYPFPLFGTYHESLVPTSNGYLSTSKREDGADATPDCPFPPDPNRWSGGARIAVYHADLDVAGGSVFYRYFEISPHPHKSCGVSVFSWEDVAIKASGETVSFQVLLFDNGDILCQYRGSSAGGGANTGAPWSIGIHNADADEGLEYRCSQNGDEPYRQAYSVLFEPYEIFVDTPEELQQALIDTRPGGKIRFASVDQVFDLSGLDAPLMISKPVAIDGSPGVSTRQAFKPTLTGTSLVPREEFRPDPVRLFRIGPGIHALIHDCDLVEGVSAGDGGAVLNDGGILKLSRVNLRDHRAGGRGGAIASLGAEAQLAICGSNLLLNEAEVAGGSVYAEGEVQMHAATAYRNRSGSAATAGSGGGISLVSTDGTFTNCTLSDNLTTGVGAALNISGGTVALEHCTVYGNRGEGMPYAIYQQGGQLQVGRCILAANPGNFKAVGGGVLTSLGSNLEDLNDLQLGETGDLPNTDPQLVPIGLHGGFVLTHLPRATSPVIDAGGIGSLGDLPHFDARGFDRVVDSDADGSLVRDIGATEAGERWVVNLSSGSFEGFLPPGDMALLNAVEDAPDGAHIVFDASLAGQEIALTSQLQAEQSFLFFDGSPAAANPLILRRNIDQPLFFLLKGDERTPVSLDSLELEGRISTPLLNLSAGGSSSLRTETELLFAAGCKLLRVNSKWARLEDVDLGFGSGATITLGDGTRFSNSGYRAFPDFIQLDAVRAGSFLAATLPRSSNRRLRIAASEFAGGAANGIEAISWAEIELEDVVSRDHPSRGVAVNADSLVMERFSLLRNLAGGGQLEAGRATLRNGTISGNQLTQRSGFDLVPQGGANLQYVGGTAGLDVFFVSPEGSLLEHLTIYDNTYHSVRYGEPCTIHDDLNVDQICDHTASPEQQTGGLLFRSGSHLQLRNCLLARNRITYPKIEFLPDDPSGWAEIDNLGFFHRLVDQPDLGDYDFEQDQWIDSLGGNLLDTDEFEAYGIAVAGDLSSVDPQLGPLFDHGGGAPSHLPLATSPALDAALDTPAAGEFDVRGFPRNADGDASGGAAPDIGAVEAAEPLIVTRNDDGAIGGGRSLRDAIAEVDEHGRITFAARVSGEVIDIGRLNGTGQPLDITKAMTIDATSLPGGITIDGGASTALMLVHEDLSAAVHAVSFVNGYSRTGGGGIGNAANLLLTRSLIAGNTSDGLGGGIYTAGALTLHNVTITGNHAAEGGALSTTTLGSGPIAFHHCTVARNTADKTGGCSINASVHAETSITLASSIFSNNTEPDGRDLANFGGNATDYISLGFNLSDELFPTSTSHPDDIPVTNPLLPRGPIDRGGFALVMPPGEGSPATDGGEFTFGQPNLASGHDARGALRNLGARGRRLDIGAYEAYSRDRDADLMPDRWEEEQALDPEDPSDALVDGDCDGETHLDEFQNGNDPWENYTRFCDLRPAPVWTLGDNGTYSVSVNLPSLTPPTQTQLVLGMLVEVSTDLADWRPYSISPSGVGAEPGEWSAPLSLPRPGTSKLFYRGRYFLDLNGSDLDGVDLSGVNLGGLNLNSADFSGAILQDVDFSDANLEGANFEGADLSGADFAGAMLSRAEFGGAILQGAFLFGARNSDIQLTSFGESPTAPVETSLPLFQPLASADLFSDDHPEAGSDLVSHNTITLMFAPGTTVGEANQILADADAKIVGAIPALQPGQPAMFCLRTSTESHAELTPLLSSLEEDPAILHVAPELPMTTTVIPNPQTAAIGWRDWRVSETESGGNWGMKDARVTQLWNFNEAISKRIASGEHNRIQDVGVADGPIFAGHPDFQGISIQSINRATDAPNPDDIHGTHVTGTICAAPGPYGVDGVSSNVRITHVEPSFFVVEDDAVNTAVCLIFGNLSSAIGALESEADVAVINVSLGMYKTSPIGILNPIHESSLPKYADMFALMWAQTSRPLLVNSAGNESVSAEWTSPYAYAALRNGVERILVVEAHDRYRDRTGFSNRGGQISAAGKEILSSVPPAHHSESQGTSMAAPHVSGAAAYLLSLDPTLDADELLDLLVNTAASGNDGAAPRLDAWAAAMEIDTQQENTDVLRMLLDIDDGTLDGNQRVIYRVDLDADEMSEDPTIPIWASENYSEDIDGDGGIGDGVIDMSDYRRARDWALICTEKGIPFALDGGFDHPKFDVNRNGIIETNAESFYPRNDFNGDGRGETAAMPAPVPGAFGGGNGTDLQVLAHLFDDPNYTKTELLELGFDTADLELSLYWFSVANRDEGRGFTDAVVTVRNASSPALFEKVNINVDIPAAPDFLKADLVLSLPIGHLYEVEIWAASGEEGIYGETRLLPAASAGQDLYFSPRAFEIQQPGP